MESVLLVEDDELIASGLVYALTQEGYTVVHCKNVAEATEKMQGRPFSLGLLDLSLPDGTGFTIGGELTGRGVPVIFLTAVDDEGNIVKGLEMGAQDYITKPFRLRELLARVKNALHRSGAAGERQVEIAIEPDIRIDPARAKVYRGGREIELTATEYRLLLAFAGHRGQVLSRTQLLEGLWDGAGSFVNDNTLTVSVKRLREKLGDDGHSPQIIQTVRGMGYRMHG